MSHRNRPEHDHERNQVCPFYGGLGIEVYPNSTRVKPVGVRPGIADLTCFFPRLAFHFYHETKLEGKRQTEEQYKFEQNCIATNTAYVLGGIDEAMDFIVFLEIAERVGPTIRVRPRNEWPNWSSFIEIGNEWSRSNYRRLASEKYGYRKAA